MNAFPGHNLTVGALGVFILWLGWYGFNGAAATSFVRAWLSLCDDNDLPGNCDRGLHDFHLGKIRQA